MQAATATNVQTGLRRIEGQVRGLQRMVEEDRYCIDLLAQMKAVRAAIQRLEDLVLRDHVGHCVAGALASGDAAARQAKIDELITAVGRMTR